ncbi:hypothetical protein PTTG_26473 [Puccinia triticina 1-1 BBBD Race 1]|uniref:Uncharacterized protein n=1 Tax=Puccinia triticina (isolate 1-1 / race 1 (BBBD)) TaxID=630390 RepID=A0A180GT19_PUCT1|nr:hypothetical protein PTTG_26473 [Puccinia triticina 1-1 BBBD Race 1]WAR58918.1 hypothetical protein PtB15_10B258 [Puccinia triticina]
MSPAGAIWNLYVVSAVMALVSLPAVELAEVQRHALLRRSPQWPAIKAPPGPMQCGKSFGEGIGNAPKGMLFCQSDSGTRAFCQKDLCHSENKPATRGRSTSINEFFFQDCLRYPKPSEAQNSIKPKTVPKTYPVQYCTKNDAGFIWLTGWDDSNDKTPRQYRCPLNRASGINMQRPWCNGCTLLPSNTYDPDECVRY